MPDTYVLVCQNADCKARGAAQILEKLESLLKDSGNVAVRPYMCFGACQAGPNIVVYPHKVWYCGVRDTDLDEIAASARGGPAVERLTRGIDPSLRDLIFQLLDAGLF